MKKIAKLNTVFSTVLVLAFAAPAAADTVNISADNGNIVVSGLVVAVTDSTMTVQTDVGPLTFNVEEIKCEGAGCPTLSLDNIRPTAG